MMMNSTDSKLTEIASRIREMREISDFSIEDMAKLTDTTPEEYISYENAEQDLPFSFIHKCALAFGLEITNLQIGRASCRERG